MQHVIYLLFLLFLFHRSKSRSVDHGLAAPFDLDSLRSKVEGRFESVDRLTSEYRNLYRNIFTSKSILFNDSSVGTNKSAV